MRSHEDAQACGVDECDAGQVEHDLLSVCGREHLREVALQRFRFGERQLTSDDYDAVRLLVHVEPAAHLSFASVTFFRAGAARATVISLYRQRLNARAIGKFRCWWRFVGGVSSTGSRRRRRQRP